MTTKLKGVMIVGIDMPRNCVECPCASLEVFSGNFNTTCLKCNVLNKEGRKTKRPSWCHIKEIK